MSITISEPGRELRFDSLSQFLEYEAWRAAHANAPALPNAGSVGVASAGLSPPPPRQPTTRPLTIHNIADVLDRKEHRQAWLMLNEAGPEGAHLLDLMERVGVDAKGGAAFILGIEKAARRLGHPYATVLDKRVDRIKVGPRRNDRKTLTHLISRLAPGYVASSPSDDDASEAAPPSGAAAE